MRQYFPRSNNVLSAEGSANVALVYQRLQRLPFFHLPAFALMDVAHDLHSHGSAHENVLAEHMVAGVAQGLGVYIEGDQKYPVCRSCGKRHPPMESLLKMMEAFRKVFAGR